MASLKKAIEAKCKDCTYDQFAPGTWREQVEECTVRRCPLWEVRPISSAGLHARRTNKVTEVDIDAILGNLEDDTEEVPV